MKILKEEIRYPQKGDTFFIDQGPAEHIAWLNRAFQEFGNYANSYQTGALCLLENALEDKNLRDYNVYPAVFLIRHYVELRLKELILGIRFCFGESIAIPATHRLENLWGDFKSLYRKMGKTTDGDDFSTANQLIEELCQKDPNSMSFRYPVDKDGNKIQQIEYLNLHNLKEIFIRFCFMLDGIAMSVASVVENMEDMLMTVYRIKED